MNLTWSKNPEDTFSHDVAQWREKFNVSKFVSQRKNMEVNSDKNYHNVPKFSDRQVWANSADPDQTVPRGLIRVYTVCNSLCIFWMHYCKEKPSCSSFRVITTNFRVSEILGILW